MPTKRPRWDALSPARRKRSIARMVANSSRTPRSTRAKRGAAAESLARPTRATAGAVATPAAATLGRLFDQLAAVQESGRRDRIRLALLALLTRELRSWALDPTPEPADLARLMGCSTRTGQRTFQELRAFLARQTWTMSRVHALSLTVRGLT